MKKLAAALTLVIVPIALVVGCGGADPEGSTLAGQGFGPKGTGSTTQAGTLPGGSCAPTGAAPSAARGTDPSTLPACCAAGQSGKAHCVATSDVPASFASQLGACQGATGAGLCVPDPFISNPSYAPKKCASLGGAEGACMSVCVPQVAQYASLLPVDTCAADEKCAPCIDPTTGQPSGACSVAAAGAAGPAPACTPSIGITPSGTTPSPTGPGTPNMACPYQGPPLMNPQTLQPCGVGGAHCVDPKLVPTNMQAQLAQCQTGGFCVPDNFIVTGGNFIPAGCRSLNNAEGRCLHVNLPEVTAQAAMLPVSSCAPYERCAPCFDPITGQPTAACRQSCDPGPREQPVVFPGCCNIGGQSQGRCIPSGIVPNDQKENLDSEACGGGTGAYCVPMDYLVPTQPRGCQASSFLLGSYSGICVSKCLDLGFQELALDDGNCDSLHTCAPCVNPLDGKITPGCQ